MYVHVAHQHWQGTEGLQRSAPAPAQEAAPTRGQLCITSVCNDEGEEVLAVPLSAQTVDLLAVKKYLQGRWSKVQRRK